MQIKEHVWRGAKNFYLIPFESYPHLLIPASLIRGKNEGEGNSSCQPLHSLLFLHCVRPTTSPRLLLCPLPAQ